ncbi:MAG: ribosome small subunit-dependent GTPase A [Clostridiaceae bacterium]|nr:ribosome small subunit-dependent GTPase A [Clostridia bacterium]MDY3869721.1 ribosome small subunit-dependent GTPase A [Clostridiaceae bacterium]
MEEKRTGVVIKGIGGNYDVACGDEILRCRASAKLRRDGVLAAGEYVTLRVTGSGGYILERQPRRNGLIRPAIANIDQLVILCSQAPPVTDPYLIDKVTVVALYQGIQPIILLNKCDLHPSGELYDAYQKAGFPVVRASAVTGEGVEELTAMLAGKISAFTGNSAIGKSSILNRIDSRFGLQVGDMSEKIARGRHTTRHVELLRLGNGGLVADTPGFSTFDAVRMEKLTRENLQHYFPELEPYFARCRFSDCRHIKEPGCLVREAVERGDIARSRYESYCKLYEEVAAQKLWR